MKHSGVSCFRSYNKNQDKVSVYFDSYFLPKIFVCARLKEWITRRNYKSRSIRQMTLRKNSKQNSKKVVGK